jgi:hypothetical protein
MYIAHSKGTGEAEVKYCSIIRSETEQSNITVEVTPGGKVILMLRRAKSLRRSLQEVRLS